MSLQHTRMAFARGQPSVGYGRQKSPKWSTAPGVSTQNPTKHPAAPVNVADSQPGMLEDARLETVDLLPG